MAESVDRGALDPARIDRRALLRLAYRLLGSVEDAEDVVQDAHVKLLALSRAPDDAQAWLFRAVTNLAIDRLRHLKVQRRHYVGPWLPEPLDTAADGGEAAADRGDELSVGMLLLLERLSVTERVAFVLREAFELDFAEMARVLEVRADACRQRYRRARRKLEGQRRPPTPTAGQRRLLQRLSDAVMAGDRSRLTRLLSEDAVLLSDGGGRVSAAVRPVEDPRRIAQVMVHLAARQNMAGMAFEWRALNDGAGLLIRRDGVPFACVQVAGSVDGERAERLYVMRNPDKLARL